MSVLSPDQRATHLATGRALFAHLEEIRELADGYEFHLAEDPRAISRAAEFITLEKLCCPFLHFALEIEREGGPVWLRLSGRDGVKAFIREEISSLLGNAIDWK